jgi:hypothetical protein
MSGKREAAKAALYEHIGAAHMERALDSLEAAGLLDRPSNGGGRVHAVSNNDAVDALKIAKAQANAREHEAVLRLVQAGLARLEMPMPKAGGTLDPWALSSAAKAKGWDTQKILELKAQAARAGLLS